MSKTASRDLFNVSLTEVVIVLFFILLLFAFSEIASLIGNSDRLSGEVQILEGELLESRAEVRRQDEILSALTNEADSDSVGIPPDDIIAHIDPDAPAQDLSPVEEIRRAFDLIDVLMAENAELNEEFRQRDAESPAAESIDDVPDFAGSEGECLGSFIDCAQHCWPLEATVDGSTREYEYLLDIGFCEDTYLVQRSSFEIAGEYSDADLAAIAPAREVTGRGVLDTTELGQYLRRIRAWGENRPEGAQCKFAANLVDLESTKAQWTLASDRGPVPQNLFTNIVNETDATYAQYRARFDMSRCETADAAEKPIEDFSVPDAATADEQAVESTDETAAPVVEAQLHWEEGRIDCPRRAFRSPEMTISMTVDVTAEGEISFSYPRALSRDEGRIVDLLEAAILDGGATVPLVDGRRVPSSKTYQQRIPENICR